MAALKSTSKAKATSTTSKKTAEASSLLRFSGDSQTRVSALLCGRSKAGKTKFACSFPKPFVINTDKGLATVKKENVPFYQIERMTPENKSDKSVLKSWVDVHKILHDLKYQEGPYWEPLAEAGYMPETIVLDSVSSLSDLLEAEIIADPPNEKDRNDALQLQDYNIIQRRLFSILDLGRELPYNWICTVGIDMDKDDLGKMIENPSATGSKLGPKIPHFFDEVYYHFYDKEKGKWVLSPLQTRYFPHSGSRHYLGEMIENPLYSKVKKYYEV